MYEIGSSSDRYLITGGAGFGGHHLVEHLLKNTLADIVIVDKLTYASRGFDRLRDIEVWDPGRVQIFSSDIAEPWSDGLRREIGSVDWIIHMAAETHVDRSIADPRPFVRSNVLGTVETLEFAILQDALKGFIYFSTDEVFGPAPEGVAYKEWDRYNSGNPYAASKAGGEEMALAYANTHRLPMIITHTMNLFGERQHPEKFIPLCIRKIRDGETITIHSDKTLTKSGSRFWIHCRNMSDALLHIMESVPPGKDVKLNIVGEAEASNLEVAQIIADEMGKPLFYKMVDFHSSRPGHDLRYALDGTLLSALGWRPPRTFEESLRKTVRWTLERPEWL